MPTPHYYTEPVLTLLSRPSFTSPEHLPINWIGESTDGERLAEFAGRLCYMSQHNPAKRETRDYLENIKKQGHGSVLEHANYSLLLEGVSRSLTHELVRHRAGFAYSQLSQRYVDESAANFVIPPAVIGDESLEGTWRAQVEQAQGAYASLVAQLMERYGWVADKVHRRKMAREAARAVLPNATETKIVVTANARAWRTMLELRSSEGAELKFAAWPWLSSAVSSAKHRDSSPTSRSTLEKIGAKPRESVTTKSESQARLENNHCVNKFCLVFCAATCGWHLSCALASLNELHDAHLSQLEILAADAPQTTNRDGMTRIGFAYNQKPDLPVGQVSDASSEPRRDEEPPSTSDVYAEWDSAETIDAVAAALSTYGDVIRLEATEDFPERLRAERPDIVFNIAEGLYGTNREAHVPAICEFFGIPYSGSDPFTLSLCLHKARTKDVLTAHGIPTAPFVLIESVSALETLVSGRLGLGARLAAHAPLFLKPVQEGSSKGITEKNLVRSRSEFEAHARYLLETYAQPVIAEVFLPGAEFTCGVLGNGVHARVLPLVGMNFESLPHAALPIYGFEAKWIWDSPEEPLHIFECPAPISTLLQSAIEEVVLRAYRVLGCRDWARVDVRLDAAGVPNIVELNPLPGILPNPRDNSCLPKAARAAGLSYEQLIQIALSHAAERSKVSLPRSSPPSRYSAAAEAVA